MAVQFWKPGTERPPLLLDGDDDVMLLHTASSSSRVPIMANQQSRKMISSRRGVEVNTMAILDASGFTKDSQDLSDDRMAFLEAVRSACVVPENGVAPTRKMLDAIFQILKDEDSLELVMTSYHLLNELDKSFPRLHVSEVDLSSSTSPSNVTELLASEEVWSPFLFRSEVKGDAKRSASLDPSGFQILIQDLVKVVSQVQFEELETKTLRNMLLLQYLISVLEGDFTPRNSLYKENRNWNLLKESLVNIILGSRKISYKGLVKECLLILLKMSHAPNKINHDSGLGVSAETLSKHSNYAIAVSFLEGKKCTCIALQKFLLMAMELDASRKEADLLGLTSRSDGVRIPVAEIIQDEFTYNRDSLTLFLQVLNDSKWKLEIVVQYFQKYISKPSVRTRRSSEPTEDATFSGILKSFSNTASTKSIVKKIGYEVVQSLLAHAFQAYLSLTSQPPVEGISCSQDAGVGSLMEICQGLISAFTNLRKVDEHMEIFPFGREALFTATTILSAK